jgi:hypothetical protein
MRGSCPAPVPLKPVLPNHLAHSQFLAPEKLRGCGGVLLDAAGRRFVDELATRDVVAAAIARQPGAVAWLLLGPEGAHQFGEAALNFYAAKGLVTKVCFICARSAVFGFALACGMLGCLSLASMSFAAAQKQADGIAVIAAISTGVYLPCQSRPNATPCPLLPQGCRHL